MTDTFLKFDQRIDALEDENETLKADLARLKRPFYKGLPFWGSAMGIVLVAGGWLASLWMEEPEIPRIVHSKILLSDVALARSLERVRENDENGSPLYDELVEQFAAHLKVDATKEFIADMATDHGVRTYSGSRTYLSQAVPMGRLSCLLIADNDMRAVLTSAPRTPDALRRLDQGCLGADRGTELRFTDFTPLFIPFKADPTDRVELFIHIRASSPTENLVREDGDSLIEAEVFQGSGVTFEKLRNNEIKARLELPAKLTDHALAITLNKAGRLLVDSTRAPGQDRRDFVVAIFATVVVTPEPKL